MSEWYCRDSDVEEEDLVEAQTAQEAAEIYARQVDYEAPETVYVHVLVRQADDEEDEGEWCTVRLDPEEPACVPGRAHVWKPVGAIGHGGGVIATEVCRRCGIKRVTDTWDTDPSTGRPVETISYE